MILGFLSSPHFMERIHLKGFEMAIMSLNIVIKESTH